ncbi:hypothetical protein ACFO5O_14630 [Geojedonia litorea]|uniref:Uncharacterized protein n=1 Tax=Geojedonia litorea TaxID=1268269 RepID=A0ABV9N7Q4_9FLAO
MKFRIFILTSLTVLVCKLVSALDLNWDVRTHENKSNLNTVLSSETYVSSYHLANYYDIMPNEHIVIHPEFLNSIEHAKNEKLS